MLDENKIAFGKIMGVLLSINNNVCKNENDKVPDYVIKGLTHGFEPVIDNILGCGVFNLKSDDFYKMCNIMQNVQEQDIDGLYDIDKDRDFDNAKWEFALSLLSDKGIFCNIIDKILKSKNPYLGKNKLSIADEPLFNISNNNLNKV